MNEDILDKISVDPTTCCHSWQVIDKRAFFTVENGLIADSYVEKYRCRECGSEEERIVTFIPD